MVILVGTGGHAKVVFEALVGCGVNAADIFPRANEVANGNIEFMGNSIETPEFPNQLNGQKFHIAIGDNLIRARLYKQACDFGGVGETIIHRHADVSPSVLLEAAVFCASGSIVAAQAQIKNGTIINHNAVVDHECVVGAFCHIAPGAVLGGNVLVGDGVLIGSRAVILPGLSIGNGAVIGAGSVVTKPIGEHQKWIGNGLVL